MYFYSYTKYISLNNQIEIYSTFFKKCSVRICYAGLYFISLSLVRWFKINKAQFHRKCFWFVRFFKAGQWNRITVQVQEPEVIWGMLFLILTVFEKDRLELTFLSPR